MLAHISAAREAFEEGGVIGTISSTPLGIYRQSKTLADGSTSEIAIRAFALPVSSEVHVWPEMQLRERAWFTLEDALGAIKAADLRAIVQALPAAIGGRTSPTGLEGGS